MAADSELQHRSAVSEKGADLASMPPVANGLHPPKMSRGLRELIGLSDGSGIQVGVGRTRHAGAKSAASVDNGEVSGSMRAPSGKARSVKLPASQPTASSSRAGKTAASNDKHEAVDSKPVHAEAAQPETVPELLATQREPVPAAEPPVDEQAAGAAEAEHGAASDTSPKMAVYADAVSDMSEQAFATAVEFVATTALAAALPARHGRNTSSQPPRLLPAAPSAASSPRRSQRTGVVEAVESATEQPLGAPGPPPSPQRSHRSAAAAAAAPPSPQRSVRSAALHASAAVAVDAHELPSLADHALFVHADDDMSDVTDACAVPRAARSNLDRRPASSHLGVLLLLVSF